MTWEYINHIMTCKVCYAPAKRYCVDGLEIRMESDAVYVAEQVDPESRRRALASLKANRSAEHMEYVHRRAVEIYEEKKQHNKK